MRHHRKQYYGQTLSMKYYASLFPNGLFCFYVCDTLVRDSVAVTFYAVHLLLNFDRYPMELKSMHSCNIIYEVIQSCSQSMFQLCFINVIVGNLRSLNLPKFSILLLRNISFMHWKERFFFQYNFIFPLKNMLMNLVCLHFSLFTVFQVGASLG